MSFMASQARITPPGWRSLDFERAFEDVTGGNAKVPTKDYQVAGALRVIDQGQAEVAGYVEDESLACRAPLPCILFGDHTRNLKFVDRPFALGADGVKVLTTRSGVDLRYAFHFLRTVTLPDDLGYSRHFKYLREVSLPTPEPAEQRRIADILDKADAIRRKRQQALALTDDLLRATFLDMLGDPVTNPRGWPVSALGELATVQGGLQVTHARAANPLEVPYLRVANVYRERLSLDEIKVMRVTRAELDRIRLFAGDILVVEGHGDPMEIGRCAVWDGSWQDCIHQNHLIRVRARADLVFPSYLSAFLNSPGGARQLIGFGKTTTGLNTISASQVRQTKVLVPSVSRQRDYERFSASLARCRQSLTGSSEEAAALAAALTHRAFSGEL